MLQPKNKKEYRRTLIIFLVAWLLATALFVLGLTQMFKTNCKVERDLKNRVARLETYERERDAIMSTVTGVSERLEKLSDNFDDNDMLRELRKYPNEELDDNEFSGRLNEMCAKLATVVEQAKAKSEKLTERSDECQQEITKIERSHQLIINEKNAEIARLNTELTITRNQGR